MDVIEKYKFGEIVIDGEKYKKDVELRWTGQVLTWKREEEHTFQYNDLRRTFGQQPDLIIFGTGHYGKANIDGGLRKAIRGKGIHMIEAMTEAATTRFNEIREEEPDTRVVGLFHISC